MKIALTGGSGFVGRYVLTELLNSDDEIVVATRTPVKLAANDRIRAVELDISEPDDAIYHRLGCPDALIHLAWNGLPNYHSHHHFETELPAQYQFLKKMVESGLPSVLVAGTCFEYGMQSGELNEDTPCQPENAYGLAKDTLRRQLQLLAASTSFELTWTRLFYMYGDRQHSNSLFSQLKCAVERGDSMFDMSGGEQLRDYLPIETVAAMLVKLSSIRSTSQVVNVCSGKPVSIRKLVEGWLEHYGWDIQLNLGHYPYPDYEPLAFWGSNNRLMGLMESV